VGSHLQDHLFNRCYSIYRRSCPPLTYPFIISFQHLPSFNFRCSSSKSTTRHSTSTMSFCNFSGDQDMYGLGIRIGFYCHWFGIILASWTARGEFRLMKLSNFFFVGATFLALIIRTSQNNLLPVETYIVLLLAFGGYLNVVPLYLWKLFTWCEPRMDPSRYARASTGRIFQLMNFSLMIGVSVFQLWFWIGRVSAVASVGCVEFGFFFAKLPLNEKGFVVANILFHFFLLFTCLGVVAFILAKQYGLYKGKKHKKIG
jgi:hypothetical protein